MDWWILRVRGDANPHLPDLLSGLFVEDDDMSMEENGLSFELTGGGRVYKRCGCRSVETGRQVWRCPTLVDERHGRWYFAVQVPGADGRRRRVRRGGFATRAQAERACWELCQLPGPRAVARTWTVDGGHRFVRQST